MTDRYAGRPTEIVQTQAANELAALILFRSPLTTLATAFLRVQQEAWDHGYSRGFHDAMSEKAEVHHAN